jgi:triphosphoribosyl-dephospho-CoA synthase
MRELSIGQCASLACLLEVSAPKPGNVHRGADFEDMTFADFAASAVAISPPMERAAQRRVGQTVLDAIHATRQVTHANTNLGIVLLLAPLAAVPRDRSLASGLAAVLERLTPEDARDVYEALRIVSPGGLDRDGAAVERHDVHAPPPEDLLEAMRAAAEWDLVARQYANGFREVFEVVKPWLLQDADRLPLSWRIVHAHVRMMHEYPDSLIARKCGQQVALEAAGYAGQVLGAGPPDSDAYADALADLDFWCRCDGHRRNPGTTADLLAAGLFACLRDGELAPPFA